MNLIPELRFPEFTGKDGWKNSKLLDVLFEHKETSDGSEEVYSVSVHKGIVNQIEHLGRRFAASSTDNYKRVLPGDVVYTKSPTGDFPFGIIKQNKSDKPVIVSPLYGVFTPETKWLGLIIDAYFESPQRTYNYLESIVQKGAKNTINIRNDVFLSKHLVLPRDREEQQKIASCLSTLDNLITAHNDKLDALKDHKKGLLQNLFPQEGETVPKVRFPEFEGDGEWIETTLEQVADYENGKAHEKDIDENGDFIVANSKFISTEGETVKYTATAYCPANLGDILMVLSDVPNGKAIAKCFFVDEENRYSVNQRICRITATDCDSRFLFYIMDKNAYFLSFDDGVKQTNLRKSDVLEFPFRIPTNPVEQTKIASCLSAVDELITAQQEKIEQLQQHKKGLMQGLFPKIES